MQGCGLLNEYHPALGCIAQRQAGCLGEEKNGTSIVEMAAHSLSLALTTQVVTL